MFQQQQRQKLALLIGASARYSVSRRCRLRPLRPVSCVRAVVHTTTTTTTTTTTGDYDWSQGNFVLARRSLATTSVGTIPRPFSTLRGLQESQQQQRRRLPFARHGHGYSWSSFSSTASTHDDDDEHHHHQQQQHKQLHPEQDEQGDPRRHLEQKLSITIGNEEVDRLQFTSSLENTPAPTLTDAHEDDDNDRRPRVTTILTTPNMKELIHGLLECLPERERTESLSAAADHHRRQFSWKDRWQHGFSRYQQEVYTNRKVASAVGGSSSAPPPPQQQQQQMLVGFETTSNTIAAGESSVQPSVQSVANENNTTGMALALLRMLKQDEWKMIDAFDDEDDEEEEHGENCDAEESSDNDQAASTENGFLVKDAPLSPPPAFDLYSHDDAPDDAPDDAHDNNSEKDDSDDEIEQILDLVQDAKSGLVVLTSRDYNMIIARLAIAPELPIETILEYVMETYRQMVEMTLVGLEESGPNTTTYELLIQVLGRRLSSPKTAIDVLHEMMESDAVQWTPQTLQATIQLCQRAKDTQFARTVLQHAVEEQGRSFSIPNGVLLAVLDMLKLEDEQDAAIELLELARKELGDGNVNQNLDKMFTSCIQWPQRSRSGNMIENTEFLSKIQSTLENDPVHFPGFPVWKTFITASARRARQNQSRWELVARALRKLSTDNPHFWPDHVLLKYGLQASEALLDSKLASTLITRVIHHERSEHVSASVAVDDDTFESDISDFLSDDMHFSFGITDKSANSDSSLPGTEGSELGSLLASIETLGGNSLSFESDAADGSKQEVAGRDWSDLIAETTQTEENLSTEALTVDHPVEGKEQVVKSTPPPPTSRIVFRDILKAMEVCVHSNDMQSGQSILDSVEAFPDAFPATGQRVLNTLALKGFAAIGDYETSESLLSTMIANDMKPREDAFGAVLYSFAVANQPDKARDFMQSMKTGHFGQDFMPGASCYNASMLAYIRASAWTDVISTYEGMKESKVKADPTTFNGVLLASFQVGGRAQVHAMAKELFTTGAQIGRESCELTLEILIPEVLAAAGERTIRQQLRVLSEEVPSMTNEYLNLNRALRTAELEEGRKSTNGLSAEDIAKRRDNAWRTVLGNILDCVVKKA